MHTTVDESTGVRDARFTEHTRRSAFILAVHRAVEIDGVPMPRSIDFAAANTTHVFLWMDNEATGDVDDWAALLDTNVEWGRGFESAGRALRNYGMSSNGAWHGFTISMHCHVRQDTEVTP